MMIDMKKVRWSIQDVDTNILFMCMSYTYMNELMKNLHPDQCDEIGIDTLLKEWDKLRIKIVMDNGFDEYGYENIEFTDDEFLYLKKFYEMAHAYFHTSENIDDKDWYEENYNKLYDSLFK